MLFVGSLLASEAAGAGGANDSVKAGTGGAWVGGEEPRWLYRIFAFSILPSR